MHIILQHFHELLLHWHHHPHDGWLPWWDAMVAFLLVTVLKFSSTYLKRDPNRRYFFANLLLLTIGITIVTHAPELEEAFWGWELVGVASFLLIGFAEHSSRAALNSFRAWIYYRIGDFFFLNALVFAALNKGFLSGLCLIFAVLPKSGLFPFVGWLYRAMEGPTPSSAIFYGALSSHLGSLVLLKFSDLWEPYSSLRYLLCAIGIISALISILVGRTRTDVKSTIAFATQAQVGLIFIELGLGFDRLVFVHILFNASLRTWQLLRAATAIQDVTTIKLLVNSIEQRMPEKWQQKLYWFIHDTFHINRSFERLGVACQRLGIFPVRKNLKTWFVYIITLQMTLNFLPLFWISNNKDPYYLAYFFIQVTILGFLFWTYRHFKQNAYVQETFFRLPFNDSSAPNRYLGITAFLLWTMQLALPGTPTYWLEEHLLATLYLKDWSAGTIAILELWLIISLLLSLIATRVYLAAVKGPVAAINELIREDF